MKTTRTFILMMLAALLIPATALFAAESGSKKSELRERFKERYPQIQQLKQSFIIGETSDGFVDWVKKKDTKSASLVSAENDDRRQLYKLLAEEESKGEVKITAEDVGKRAAKRNYEKLKDGEYYKDEDGKWTKKGGGES